MAIDQAVSTLSHQQQLFGLYADFVSGISTSELASEFRQSEEWVKERIESALLRLETQVRTANAQGCTLALGTR